MIDAGEGDAYWSLGSLMVLKATGENTNGSFSMVEERIPAGQSPPLHVHQSDEMFYVLDGTVTFEVSGGGSPQPMDRLSSRGMAFPTATSPRKKRGGSCSFANPASNGCGRRSEVRPNRGRSRTIQR